MILTRSRGRCPPLPHPEERRLGRVNLSTARRDYEEGHDAGLGRPIAA